MKSNLKRLTLHTKSPDRSFTLDPKTLRSVSRLLDDNADDVEYLMEVLQLVHEFRSQIRPNESTDG